MRRWITVVVVLGLVLVLGGWYWRKGEKPVAGFRTVAVARGDLAATITATGTLEPEEVVDVGAQVAGKINSFGKDPKQPGKAIDYGSEVEEGTVLAQIDAALYTADVAAAQAAVEQAKANVQRSQADLGQMQAKVNQTSNDWKRAQQAGASAGLSQSDLDTYKANYEVAQANLAVGEAAVIQAQTGQAQSAAALQRAQQNMDYCTIQSPVKGTIIDRRVNIGQTVVAALNAPSLFLIAKDLKRMQVWASVNEADIGSIKPGERATFTVDAFPGRTFEATVGKVRLNASMTQNVVTYTVEVNADNSDGKLLPYMTANVRFELDKRTGVLMVPNAALRWTPQTQQIAPDARGAQKSNEASGGAAGKGSGVAMTDESGAGASRDRGTVWVKDGTFARPVQVHVGLSDGLNTEIDGKGLEEGSVVITGDADMDEGTGDARNPFVPQFGRRKS
jgi:HlyD family secretion protein